MKYKTQWTHYSGLVSPENAIVYNSSILLFEKKDWWKVICIKIKGMKKKKNRKE